MRYVNMLFYIFYNIMEPNLNAPAFICKTTNSKAIQYIEKLEKSTDILKNYYQS